MNNELIQKGRKSSTNIVTKTGQTQQKRVVARECSQNRKHTLPVRGYPTMLEGGVRCGGERTVVINFGNINEDEI